MYACTTPFNMEGQAKEPSSRTEENRPFLDFEYLYSSWVGRFKIIEFVTSLLAGALVPSTVEKHGGGFGFMSFVAWITFINVLIDIILHLVRVWEKLVFVHTYPQVMVCLCFLGSISLLVAGFVALGISQYATEPGLGYASAFFAFICCVVLGIECIFHYRSYRDKQHQNASEMSTTAEGDPNIPY